MAIEAQGVNLVVEIDENQDGNWKFAICETSSEFSGSTATTTTSTKCDGGTPKVGLGSLEWSITGSGAASLDADPLTQLSYPELLNIWKSKKKVGVRRIESTTGIVSMQGTGYVTEISDSASSDNLVEFNYTIMGDGEIHFGDSSSS